MTHVDRAVINFNLSSGGELKGELKQGIVFSTKKALPPVDRRHCDPRALDGAHTRRNHKDLLTACHKSGNSLEMVARQKLPLLPLSEKNRLRFDIICFVFRRDSTASRAILNKLIQNSECIIKIRSASGSIQDGTPKNNSSGKVAEEFCHFYASTIVD